MAKKNRWDGRLIIFLLLLSFITPLNFNTNPSKNVQAATGTFDEDFTTTTFMDGSNTNVSGWGTGEI